MSELNIPDTWVETSLDIVCTKITDGSHNPPKEQLEGLPMLSCRNIKNGKIVFTKFRLINPKDFEKEDKRTLITEGDVVLSIVGTIGESAVIIEGTPRFTCQRSMGVFGPSESINSYFLRYYLSSKNALDYFFSNAKGTTQKGIYLGSLKKMPITLPPENEQKRIVQKIESCFEKIDETEASLNKVETLLSKYRESLLAKAFRGELIPQNPDDEPASVLLSKIREEREKAESGKKKKVQAFAPIKDDEKPFDIPESWEWVRLADLCLSIVDGDHQAPAKVDSGIPFFVISDMNKGVIDFKGNRYVPETYFNNLSRERKPEIGDILYSVTGSFGLSALVEKDTEFCFQRHIALLRPFFSSLRDYIFLYLKSSLAFDSAIGCATGSAQKTVPITGLRNFLVPLPPLNEQKRLIRKCQYSLEHIFKANKNIASKKYQLVRLKESILANAFKGRLVEQAESEGTGHELLEKILAKKKTEEAKKKTVKKKTTKKKK